MAKVLIVGLMISHLGCQTENLNPSEMPKQPEWGRKELKTAGVKFNGKYLEFKNHLIFTILRTF